jgi:hypothetical protein
VGRGVRCGGGCSVVGPLQMLKCRLVVGETDCRGTGWMGNCVQLVQQTSC